MNRARAISGPLSSLSSSRSTCCSRSLSGSASGADAGARVGGPAAVGAGEARARGGLVAGRRRGGRAPAAAPGPGRPRRGGAGRSPRGSGATVRPSASVAQRLLPTAGGVGGERPDQVDLDQAAGSRPDVRRRLAQPVEQAERLVRRAAGRVGAVLGEDEPHQGEVVVLAQVLRRRRWAPPPGRAPSRPAAGSAPWRTWIRARMRRDRPHVGEEARAVELLGPVEVVDRPGQVALGGGEQRAWRRRAGSGSRSPAPGRPAGRRPRRCCRAASRSSTSTSSSARATCSSAVGARHRLAVALGLPAAPVRRARGPSPAARTARHRSASTTVPLSASTRLPAACRLATACPNVVQRLRHVAAGPGGEAQEPGRTAAGEVVVRAGEVEGAPGVLRRALDVTAGLGQRRPGTSAMVAGRVRSSLGVGPRRRSPWAGRRGQRASASSSRGRDGVEVTGDHAAGRPRTR